MSVPLRSLGFLALALAIATVATPARAGDVASDMKKAGQSVAKAAEKFGHQVAESGKEVGESVSDAAQKGAKTAWYTSQHWATKESKRVADATVRWWDDVIKGKEDKRDRLRKENESLMAKDARKHGNPR